MKFTLVKGVPERLEEYREVFYGSKLYDAYFAEGDSLNENLLRAMADGDLYVAMSPGDEAVGVMYMTRNGARASARIWSKFSSGLWRKRTIPICSS